MIVIVEAACCERVTCLWLVVCVGGKGAVRAINHPLLIVLGELASSLRAAASSPSSSTGPDQ